MSEIAIKDLYNWCRVPVDQLVNNPSTKEFHSGYQLTLIKWEN
jgi:hypothetical protein